MKSMKLSKIAAFAAFLGFSAAVAASGGPSGPAVTYPVQGHIGEVIVNPYNVAPLTAVIRDGGYKLDDVTVKNSSETQRPHDRIQSLQTSA